jgi:multiple sugar transport system permease protein
MLRSSTFYRVQKGMLPYMLMLPAVLALLAFSIYPFISGIWYSFTSIGWVDDVAKFVGLDNYKLIFEGNVGAAQIFKESLWRSFYWTGATIAGQFALGLCAALILNEKFPGRTIFRIGILVSIAIPTVVLALIWNWMYDPFYGLINFYLQKIGILSGPKMWVGQTNSPLWPLIIVAIWRGFPFMSLMLLSGLQGIPDELYEAAKVDGANIIDRFIHITLPQLRTIIIIALMLHTLWWWNHFDIVMIVGSGSSGFGYGTATIPYLAWVEAFRWSHLSRGAAISVIAMLVVGGIIYWNARRELRSVSNQ